MGLIDMASWNSRWRGLDYFEKNKVIKHKVIANGIIYGKVSGSNNNVYDVSIDLEHPVNSVCNCPYAVDTKRRVCKHMVALFCTTLENPKNFFDDMVEVFNKKIEEHLTQLDELRKKQREQAKKDLVKHTKDELMDMILDAREDIDYLENELENSRFDKYDDWEY